MPLPASTVGGGESDAEVAVAVEVADVEIDGTVASGDATSRR